MAHVLKGVTFFTASNNGVIALIQESVHRDNQKVQKIARALKDSALGKKSGIYGSLDHMEKPVFTFVAPDRLTRESWFTGEEHLYEAVKNYVFHHGGAIVFNSSVWVPFSNGTEQGMNGPDAQRRELGYVTSEEQFMRTFGTMPEDLMDWYRNYLGYKFR